MKTIFITIYDGLISKNILRTDVLKILKQQEKVRIVLFVQEMKINYYRKHFSSERVFVEVSPQPSFPILERIFSFVSSNSLTNVNTLYRQKLSFLKPHRLHYFIAARILRILGYFKYWNKFVSWLYYNVPDSSFDEYILKYRPDLFFVNNLVSSEDTRLMKFAKRNKIHCVAMTKSWDNVTGKSFLFLHYDEFIVQNTIVKEEAIKILDINPQKIHISGFPQYDIYIDENLIRSRRDFFEEIGANVDKKLILYFATGFPWTPNEHEVLEMLNNAIERGKIVEPVQVLVRFHPKYVNLKKKLDRLSHLICERPGTYTSDVLAYWEYEKKDVIHLMNSIYHSDICINTGSTTAIESMIFDKPTVAVAFDGYSDLPLHESVRRFYNFSHNEKLVELGGEDVVFSIEEFIDSINDNLENPDKRVGGRELTCERECYKIDGLAGERIANIILDNLN